MRLNEITKEEKIQREESGIKGLVPGIPPLIVECKRDIEQRK